MRCVLQANFESAYYDVFFVRGNSLYVNLWSDFAWTYLTTKGCGVFGLKLIFEVANDDRMFSALNIKLGAAAS